MGSKNEEEKVTLENDQVTETPEEVPEETPAEDPRIAELRAQLAARDAEFGKLKEALAEKTALADSQDQELSTLRTAGSVAEARIAELTGSLTEAISKYKERLYSSHPELLENMITGDTIQEIDASLDSSLVLVDKVKANIAEQSKEVKVPAGSPERTGPDLSAMSAKEKIAYAIGKEAK
jgi:chromosome segregation ATPase